MRALKLCLFAGLAAAAWPLVSILGAEGPEVDSMDDASPWRQPDAKAKVESVEGKTGKAVKFSFEDGCSGKFVMGRTRGNAEWDKAAGISFWVKGDGSDRLGGIEVVWNENYGLRYGVAFPIDSTEWRKVVVPWRDFIPELAKEGAVFIGAGEGQNAPSKLGQIWFGKWWYWKDYGAHSYTVDDIRLEPEIKLDETDYAPKGAPLDRVLAKLKAKQPVTVVTMGDSLTDFAHWANKGVNWPTLLVSSIKEKYGCEAKLVNPAIGGTELRQNLILMPRWLKQAPEPDLVTVCFGYNDWSSGMKGPMFLETYKYAVDRIRRETKGKADVLLITTCPAVGKWDEMAELAQAVRDAAAAKSAGVCDIYKAFHDAAGDNKDRLYCSDKTHMGAEGHALIAKTVMEAIERGGK